MKIFKNKKKPDWRVNEIDVMCEFIHEDPISTIHCLIVPIGQERL